MNILIDVDQLVSDKVISPQLCARLKMHAVQETGSSAINILLALGAVMIAAGVLALTPSVYVAGLLGLGFVMAGFFVSKHYAEQWGKLGSIWLVIGAFFLAGSESILLHQMFLAPIVAAVIFVVIGIFAESRLLIGLTPLALSAAMGASTEYWHAAYGFEIEQPAKTIVVFTGLALVSWHVVKNLQGVRQALAIIFARVCVILVNIAFWVGSLWGDKHVEVWSPSERFPLQYPTFSPVEFAIGWALALLLTGVWAAKRGRRFIVNTVAVFGAIHFYTQWFEYFGLHALTAIAAGVAAIVFGLGLWRYNRHLIDNGAG